MSTRGHASSAGQGGTALPALCTPSFVGRQGELEALGQALAREPVVVLLAGEAGIGKSRLVQEFLTRYGSRSATLVTACPPFREPMTLAPIVDGLRRAVADVGSLGLSTLAGVLRPVFPEWAEELPAAPEPAEDASAARHRVFRAITELLGRLNIRLLVVEDVHWADEATLEYLLSLASGTAGPISLLLTYRSEDVPAGSLLLRLSSRAPSGMAQLGLTLPPLGRSATAELMSSMLDGEPVSAEFAAFLHEHTDGVPLAVEESMRVLHGRSQIQVRDGAWMRQRFADLSVPPTIQDGVVERVRRLAPDAQTLLQAAAVLADPVDQPTLFAVCGLPAARAEVALTAAMAGGLLCEYETGAIGYRHVLTSRAVYAAVPASLRRSLHLRTARVLERAPVPPVGQLAAHYRAVGDVDRWSRCAEQAADVALASGDVADASMLLYDVVTRARLPARAVARLVGKIPLASFAVTDRYRELIRVLEASLSAGGLGHREEAELHLHLARVLVQMDQYDAARRHLEMAVRHGALDPPEAAQAMIMLAQPLATPVNRSVHLHWLRRAAAVAAGTTEPADKLRLLVNRVDALLALGEGEGWALAAQIPSDASSARERQSITIGHANVGDLAMRWGRYAEARRGLESARDLATAHQLSRLRDVIDVTRTHLDWFTGQWDGLADRAAAVSRNGEIPPGARLEAVLVLALLAMARGQSALAREHAEAVATGARSSGLLAHLMEPAAVLARICMESGDITRALELTDEPVRILQAKDIWFWATDVVPARVGALIAAGRCMEAAELVAALARGLTGCAAPAARSALVLCRAIVCEGTGQLGRAQALYERAASAWEGLPRPYSALLARERRAGCLLGMDRVGDGSSVLREVHRGLVTLGATGDARRVEHALRQHGVGIRSTWRGGSRGYGNQLSPREVEVVRFMLTGRTNREIARVLSKSPKTIAAQLNSAMRKLEVPSRAALAVRAIEAGIAPAASNGHQDGFAEQGRRH